MGLRKKLLSNQNFEFDFRNEKGIEKGSFAPLLTIYLDIAKVVSGLASGSIALLVGAATFHSTGAGHLLTSFASPLFLLALSILWGVLFMAFIVLNYEGYRHGVRPYTHFKYSRNQACGFGSLLCFAIGYVWLIFIVAGQQ